MVICVTSSRHRQTREPGRVRGLLRLALPAMAVGLLTTGVVAAAVGVGTETPTRAAGAIAKSTPAPTPALSAVRAESADAGDRERAISRSARRVTLHEKPKVTDHEFMRVALNVWPAPRAKGKPLAVLNKGSKVAITGARKGEFAQILRYGQVRWVKERYLVDAMPKPKPAPKPAPEPEPDGDTSTESSGEGIGASTSGLSSAPCPDGSGTEAGLTSSAVRLYRAVCAAFPALTTYGGYDAHGEHGSGRAIDFMTSDPSLGQAVADYARAHASELNLYDIIWAQRIWTPTRGSEGWRSMSDRGSATANHYDHVHIAVN